MQSGVPNSLSADEGANSLSVFAEPEHLTLAQDDCMDISIHTGVDKWDVIEQVHTLVLYRFDWSWATAVHSCDDGKKQESSEEVHKELKSGRQKFKNFF